MKIKPVKIELKRDAEQYSVKVARRVLITHFEKVENQFQETESSGVMQKIKKQTDLCDPIVPVFKPNGSVRTHVLNL